MKASSPILWPEAPTVQTAPQSALARSQHTSPGESAAGRKAVADRPVKARTQRRGHPDREPGLKRATFGRGAGLPTLLLLPPFLIPAIFFLIPPLLALMQSVLLSDPFRANDPLV